MILSFSREQFVKRIKDKSKVHTIRWDQPRRWKSGNKIHFWKDNPRNTSKNPYPFAIGTCIDVREIEINTIHDFVRFPETGKELSSYEHLRDFAQSDGFDTWQDLKDYFGQDGIVGRIIYWDIETLKQI